MPTDEEIEKLKKIDEAMQAVENCKDGKGMKALLDALIGSMDELLFDEHCGKDPESGTILPTQD